MNVFGTFDNDLPQKGLSAQDPSKAIITKLRSWDVLLANPKPGAHTLRSVAHINQDIHDGFHSTKGGTYELAVNFTVADAPPATPTNMPTAAPTKALMLATSAQDIVGIWRGLGTDGLYQQFNEDGTIRVSLSRDGLATPEVEMTFVFEDSRLAMKEVKATGLPPCGSRLGIYEVQLLTKDKIKFVKISDGCAPRASSTAQVHERVH